MKRENILNYVVGISSVLLVALLGWVFVDIGMDWFNGLRKPSEWIPNAVIPIVWTIIYSIFILYIIHFIKKDKDNKRIIVLLIVNGILNVLWCLIYFAFNSLLGGQIVIILNLIASVLLLKEISRSSEVYSYILTIYPIWLSFATCLNLAAWILN